MFKVVLPKVVSTSIDASSRFSTLSQLINYFVSLQCDYLFETHTHHYTEENKGYFLEKESHFDEGTAEWMYVSLC